VAVPRNSWLLRPALLLAVVACATTPAAPPTLTFDPPPPPPLTPAGRTALALAAAPPDVSPDVRVSDDTNRYPVTGSTAPAIRLQMKTNRETIPDSEYVGTTRADVQWQFRPIQGAHECELSQIAVFLHIVTTLPQWFPADEAPGKLARQWQVFLTAIEIHEHGHRTIALHTAAAIAHVLDRIHGPTCAGLKDMANLDARATWELGNRRQLDYDVATQHGASQGARWPP
jgi:predicted secreted Zn-dependent protease